MTERYLSRPLLGFFVRNIIVSDYLVLGFLDKELVGFRTHWSEWPESARRLNWKGTLQANVNGVTQPTSTHCTLVPLLFTSPSMRSACTCPDVTRRRLAAKSCNRAFGSLSCLWVMACRSALFDDYNRYQLRRAEKRKDQ